MKEGMSNPSDQDPVDEDQARIDAVVAAGPSGAFAVAGVATAIVIAIWVAFYVFAYLPRGVVQ
jgi:hypothetical protein